MSPRPQSPRRARQATDGAARSSAELLPEVYEELRRLARARLRRESHVLTLQPTALVHEAYLRVDAGAGRRWDGRGHFFAAAAIAMRRILVERARHRHRLKHGGEQHRVDITSEPAASGADPDDVLAVDDALDQLQRLDSRKAQVVMLRVLRRPHGRGNSRRTGSVHRDGENGMGVRASVVAPRPSQERFAD